MKLLFTYLAGLALMLGSSFGISYERVAPVKAISSNDFLNSIGANSAISSRGERLEKTIELVKYTGIRWIRSG